MKYIQIFLCLAFAFSAFAQDEGIQFIHENLTEAKAKAAEEGKILFVDAYTTWCGPCKMLSRTTFKDEKVAEFYNKTFVNLKLDMEKGEGPVFGKKFNVRGYPSLLFLGSNGELVHRSIGFQDATRFLALGEAAADPDKQVVTLQKRFESGERDQAFLKNYVDAMTMASMDNYEMVTKAYLEQEKDWTTPENVKFLFDYSKASMNSELFQYMLDNRALFEKEVGADRVEQKIEWAAQSDIQEMEIPANEKNALIAHYAKYVDTDKAQVLGYGTYLQTLMYSRDESAEEKYLSEVQLFMATNPKLEAMQLNSHAWRVYELSDDKLILAQAEKWIAQSVEMEPNSYNTDTQAAVLYKLGKKAEAKAAAEKSIQLAQEEGNDSSATKALLKKIEAL